MTDHATDNDRATDRAIREILLLIFSVLREALDNAERRLLGTLDEQAEEEEEE